MRACMCVCVYVFICLCMRINACMFVHAFVCLYVHVFIRLFVCSFVDLYVYAFVYAFVCLCVHLCICTNMFSCLYAIARLHNYTNAQNTYCQRSSTVMSTLLPSLCLSSTLLKVLNVLNFILLFTYFLQPERTDCGVVPDITSARYRLSE